MQVLAAAGLALTLGITLHIHAQPVMLPGWLAALPLPTELQGPAGGRMAPLPAYLLYKAVPPFRAFHGFDRWVVVALLGLAPLAGLGLTRLAAALPWPRVGRVLQGGFLALLLLEFNLFPLLNTTSMDQMDRAVDRWLAAQPASGVIVEMPLDYAEKGNTLYYWLHHGQAMVHGQGSLMPPAYLARRPVLAQWPAEPALDLLADLGVQYVLQHAFVWERDFETTTLPALAANPRLRLVEVFPHHDGVTRAIYLFALEEE